MRKTLRIYEQMPEDYRKEWLDIKQVAGFDALKFSTDKALNMLDYSDEVEKQCMVVNTDDYENWVKNGSVGKYVKEQWEVRTFYKKEDVKRFADNHLEMTRFEDMIQVGWKAEKLDDLRTYLNDRRSIKYEDIILPTEFYGDKTMALRHVSRDNQYRLYYGAFFLHGYITNQFLYQFNIKRSMLEMLIFLHTYKYFILKDLYNHYTAYMKLRLDDNKRANEGPTSKLKWFIKEGYVEKITYKNTSMYKKKRVKGKMRNMYKTTEKADKVVGTYFNWLMYKEKMPFTGKSNNTKRLTRIDMKNPNREVKWLDNKYAYMFYEYVYDYINYKSEVELFDGDMESFMKKAESREFHYSAIVNRIAYERFLSSDGKNDNSAYIKHLLESRRWGIAT